MELSTTLRLTFEVFGGVVSYACDVGQYSRGYEISRGGVDSNSDGGPKEDYRHWDEYRVIPRTRSHAAGVEVQHSVERGWRCHHHVDGHVMPRSGASLHSTV